MRPITSLLSRECSTTGVGSRVARQESSSNDPSLRFEFHAATAAGECAGRAKC